MIKNKINAVALVASFLFSGVVNAVEYEATVSFSPVLNLGLPVSGLVEKINVKTGQRVSKGDDLLSLDPAPFKTAQRRAQAKLTVQETLLKQSERDLQQQRELFDRTVLSMVELEDAELREKRDQANLEDTKGQLLTANYKLAHSKIEAPFDAVIMSVNVNEGQYVSNALQGVVLISIARLGRYQTHFNVSLSNLENIKFNLPVTIKLADKTYTGTVSYIDYASVDVSEGKSIRVAAEFASSEAVLLHGKKARVYIE